MQRREFLTILGQSVLTACAVSLGTSCGSSTDDSKDSTTTPATSFTFSNIGNASHTHTAFVLCTDLVIGNGATFLATGSGHTHTVSVSQADVEAILAGSTIEVQTTNGGHAHLWSIMKPDTACA